MTVSYRGRRFFLLDLRTLETTVVDAGTLGARTRIPAPAGLRDVDAAYLAPSSVGGAVLLVHRAGTAAGCCSPRRTARGTGAAAGGGRRRTTSATARCSPRGGDGCWSSAMDLSTDTVREREGRKATQMDSLRPPPSRAPPILEFWPPELRHGRQQVPLPPQDCPQWSMDKG
ncbi:uncharacterized protein C2845_PM02G13150 [Panicum miliaceum]|uniref:Uncharacterized protein n=1 Tax=Panicum miliaceum TaxID=4540 RepID=A0A3L6S9K3_PANMI|nr:uncharacterized protein C2845_PM02G13150 [Panicum miliaceum]